MSTTPGPNRRFTPLTALIGLIALIAILLVVWLAILGGNDDNGEPIIRTDPTAVLTPTP